MSNAILSHQLANGMVVVGEPTASVESAAFTFLLPAGCSHDPAKRAGLAALTSEMMLRGAGPRDSRAWITDLENLGVERGESVGVAQATFSGATLRDNLPICLGGHTFRQISSRRAAAPACKSCAPWTMTRATS